MMAKVLLFLISSWYFIAGAKVAGFGFRISGLGFRV
jgi:hypothetical protein